MKNGELIRPILLLENNQMDVDLTLRAFARRKLINPVEIARDGEEALAWILRWEAREPLPLVLLLDLKRPTVDGLELLRQYRSARIGQTLSVVFLTFSKEDKDIMAAYGHHANSYIVKPVDYDKFIEVATQIELYGCLLNHPPR